MSLDYLFNPRSVALLGARSGDISGTNLVFLDTLRDFNFQGRIYPINPKASEIRGLKAYPTLAEVPGPVDYVICALGAKLMPQVVEQCLAKGVKVLHIFSAGFSESGEEGRRLEQEIVAQARKGGLRIVGPNCFGLSYARSGLSSMAAMSREPGSVAIVSQSAGSAVDLTEGGTSRGLKFSKVINYGNGADLNEVDFLEYLAQDEETRVIALYIEGVRSPRFFSVLRAAAQEKPVIVVKGGRTEAGARAARSHTGSLAGSDLVWGALLRQAGALLADSLEEMEDLLVTFYLVPPPTGRRAAILIFGGGFCVQGADACEREGLGVPHLPPEIMARLAEFIPTVGTSLRNPIDVSPGTTWQAHRLFRALSILADWDGIDLILSRVHVPPASYRNQPELLDEQLEGIVRAHRELKKPVAAFTRFVGHDLSAEIGAKVYGRLGREGVPLYPSIAQAARALSRFVGYHQERQGGPARR